MNNQTKVIALLKANFTEPVYSDNIPEGITKPALVVTELANTFSRVIECTKFGFISTWRVAVYVKDKTDMTALLEKLEELDNTSTTDFQKILTQYVLTETRQPGQILTRAFVDLTLYK